ncbi:hypothetical protein GCM10025876_00830 [Demequina litorisediminis]|uniref:histidine kinase n=1 Tax=Demequina litorisediminis TaxID=1849022 RepID=A0ABQ6I7S7_9MICO|nr:hypothetical protein GCM10025876_00830 [Demequina litorisediminis]
MSPAPVDVRDLTEAVFDKAAALGARRWVLDEAADAVAPLDRDRVTQAWLQLASNAVRFSDDDSEVGIGSRIGDECIELWVRDNGVGVPEDAQSRIFTRFAQADAVRRDGSGLGLSIVTAIARGHGGHASVSSREGEGSTFTLTLPLTGSDQDNTDA